jgi:hypothetical protein
MGDAMRLLATALKTGSQPPERLSARWWRQLLPIYQKIAKCTGTNRTEVWFDQMNSVISKTVAIFRESPDASDDIYRKTIAAGIEPKHAARLVEFSPLSKCERFGTDIQIQSGYGCVVSLGMLQVLQLCGYAQAFDREIGTQIKPKRNSDRRKARLLGGFHEESIPADRCTGTAGRNGVCTDSRGERQLRPDQR